MRTEKFSEQFVIRVTPSQAAALDRMRAEGGFASRAELVRSFVTAIIEDDAKAHEAAVTGQCD